MRASLLAFILLVCPLAAWQSLLDPSLSQWQVWTGPPHPSVSIDWPGKAEHPSRGKAMGLTDPFFLFRFQRDPENRPLLRITGESWGSLITLREYRNYHLRAEVRFTGRKWFPYDSGPTDTGLIYHSQPPYGAFWNTWMTGLEYEIKDRNPGGLHRIGPILFDFLARDPEAQRPHFSLDGTWTTTGKKVRHTQQSPSRTPIPRDRWLQIDLFVLGDQARHFLD